MWFKKLSLIVTIFLITSLLVSVGLTFLKMENRTNLDQPIIITIKSGTSFNQFTQQLVDNNILATRFWLRNYVRINQEYAKIKAGTYQVLPEQSLKSLLTMIYEGKEHQFSITFVEGTTIKQWLEQLASTANITHQLPEVLSEASPNQYAVSYINDVEKVQALTSLAKQFNINAISPEGYFYPDTYAYSAGDSDLSILKRAHQKMMAEIDKLWEQRNVNLPYASKKEAITMASIIEKESGKHAEHELIASVFINRLDKGMRLQTDPTVIYGLGERYQGDITFQHLREKNQYNTRKIHGFPLTPIAMPGKHALHAAFNPASSDYLYFVSNGKGEHVFSTTLKEHNLAVKHYLKTIKN